MYRSKVHDHGCKAPTRQHLVRWTKLTAQASLSNQVVMFQADVDSWWNLSLGHAIPAFVPWHKLLPGGWIGGRMALWSRITHEEWNLYAWTSTALCLRSLKRSQNYYIFGSGKSHDHNSYTSHGLGNSYTNSQLLAAARSHCCGARNYFWAGSLLDASGHCSSWPS